MRGRLTDLTLTRDGKQRVTIELDGDFRGCFDQLYGTDVDVAVKRHREKRSLDANALYWSALTQLAGKLGVSNAWLHNSMIRQFGQPDYYGDKVAYVFLPDQDETEEKALEAETYHIKPTSHIKQGNDGTVYRAYMLMRGSSTYNTSEFSRLLNGLLEACEDAGIHIDTMSERERSLLTA